MDRGAWWATVHGVIRLRQELVTKPPTITTEDTILFYFSCEGLECQTIAVYLIPLLVESHGKVLSRQVPVLRSKPGIPVRPTNIEPETGTEKPIKSQRPKTCESGKERADVK